MDGVHDLGGVEGFGRVVVERDEPVFHHDWERRVWGVSLATFVAGISNGSQFRHAIERMDPVHYLTSSYYEHWLTGVATRVVEAGIVTGGELERRAGGSFPLSHPVLVESPSSAAPSTEAFRVGERVRVRATSARGHTRCPRYVRGRVGTVVRVDRPAPLPDAEAHATEVRRELVYSVAFRAVELWGDDGGQSGMHDVVHVDLWQSYLERP